MKFKLRKYFSYLLVLTMVLTTFPSSFTPSFADDPMANDRLDTVEFECYENYNNHGYNPRFVPLSQLHFQQPNNVKVTQDLYYKLLTIPTTETILDEEYGVNATEGEAFGGEYGGELKIISTMTDNFEIREILYDDDDMPLPNPKKTTYAYSVDAGTAGLDYINISNSDFNFSFVTNAYTDRINVDKDTFIEFNNSDGSDDPPALSYINYAPKVFGTKTLFTFDSNEQSLTLTNESGDELNTDDTKIYYNCLELTGLSFKAQAGEDLIPISLDVVDDPNNKIVLPEYWYNKIVNDQLVINDFKITKIDRTNSISPSSNITTGQDLNGNKFFSIKMKNTAISPDALNYDTSSKVYKFYYEKALSSEALLTALSLKAKPSENLDVIDIDISKAVNNATAIPSSAISLPEYWVNKLNDSNQNSITIEDFNYTASSNSTTILQNHGNNTFTIKVTSEDGTINNVYKFAYQTQSSHQPQNSEAELIALSLKAQPSEGLSEINIDLSKALVDNSAAVPPEYIFLPDYWVDKINDHSPSGLNYNDFNYTSSSGSSIQLNIDTNHTFSIDVISEDNSTRKSYVFSYARRPTSPETQLTALSLKAQPSEGLNEINIDIFNAVNDPNATPTQNETIGLPEYWVNKLNDTNPNSITLNDFNYNITSGSSILLQSHGNNNFIVKVIGSDNTTNTIYKFAYYQTHFHSAVTLDSLFIKQVNDGNTHIPKTKIFLNKSSGLSPLPTDTITLPQYVIDKLDDENISTNDKKALFEANTTDPYANWTVIVLPSSDGYAYFNIKVSTNSREHKDYVFKYITNNTNPNNNNSHNTNEFSNVIDDDGNYIPTSPSLPDKPVVINNINMAGISIPNFSSNVTTYSVQMPEFITNALDNPNMAPEIKAMDYLHLQVGGQAIKTGSARNRGFILTANASNTFSDIPFILKASNPTNNITGAIRVKFSENNPQTYGQHFIQILSATGNTSNPIKTYTINYGTNNQNSSHNNHSKKNRERPSYSSSSSGGYPGKKPHLVNPNIPKNLEPIVPLIPQDPTHFIPTTTNITELSNVTEIIKIVQNTTPEQVTNSKKLESNNAKEFIERLTEQKLAGKIKNTAQNNNAVENMVKRKMSKIGTLNPSYELLKPKNADLLIIKPYDNMLNEEINTSVKQSEILREKAEQYYGEDNIRDFKTDITIDFSDEPTLPEYEAISVPIKQSVVNNMMNDNVNSFGIELNVASISVAPKDLQPAPTESKQEPTSINMVFNPNPKNIPPKGFNSGYSVEVNISSGNSERHILQEPALLTFDLDYFDFGDEEISDKNLSIYRLNEKTNKWQAVGGTYNKANNTISTRRITLSQYTVMKSNKSFSDIDNSWAEDEINALLNKGVVDDSDDFKPEEAVTRKEFTAWLTKAYGLDKDTSEMTFTDVSKDDKYYKQLASGYEAGLFSGTSSNTFSPDNTITRQEMAALISNALTTYDNKKINANLQAKLNSFGDIDDADAWAKDALAFAIELDLLPSENGLDPNGIVTKEMAASILKKIS